jgi:hypothetical protein
MRALLVMLLLVIGMPESGAAALSFGPAEAPGLLCRQAIAAAERAYALPPHLLAAIGRVESGRRDPATGMVHPWPWTINAEGEGHFYDTKAQAIAAVRALLARGVRSIDVGCLQVNLMHHPTAFADLEQAFDPGINADYAARFLRQLYGQAGTWAKATASYHSATPELGAPYERQVMAAWPAEIQGGAGAPSALASAWTAANHMVTPPFQRDVPARIIPLARGPDGQVPQGRDLASYRAMPVLLSARPLRHAFGG